MSTKSTNTSILGIKKTMHGMEVHVSITSKTTPENKTEYENEMIFVSYLAKKCSTSNNFNCISTFVNV